jgi:hypothetical protein
MRVLNSRFGRNARADCAARDKGELACGFEIGGIYHCNDERGPILTERHHSVFFRHLRRNPFNNLRINVFKIICRSARDIELLAQEIGKFLFGEIAQFNQVGTQAATHHDLAFENGYQLGLTDFSSLNQMFA